MPAHGSPSARPRSALSSRRPTPTAGVWPVTRDIILGGRKYSAVDAFEGQYKLNELMARG